MVVAAAQATACMLDVLTQQVSNVQGILLLITCSSAGYYPVPQLSIISLTIPSGFIKKQSYK